MLKIELLRYIYIFIIFSFSFFFFACEKEINLNLKDPQNAVVVEGHIENGIPPYVMLTKNSAFFSNLNLNNIASYFISGADVKIITGGDTIQLQEYNGALLQALPDSVVIPLAQQFGLNISSASEFPPIIIYTVSIADSLFTGEFGKQYDLLIQYDGKQITSTTTIPLPVTFDSLWIEPHPNAAYADSFFQLYGRLREPATQGNFYRYFTRADDEAWLVSDQSVFDDAFINGLTFKIFIPKGHGFGAQASTNFNTSGYWNISDSVCTVKLMSIDKPHYDFWRTLEANRSSNGNPFGSFVYVKSNVNGALGVWGGYASTVSSLRVF